MKQTIYLVEAYSGSYEDYSQWNIITYHDKATAEKHRDLAQASANRALKHREKNWERDNYKECSNPYDPDMQISYDTKYSVRELICCSKGGVLKLPKRKA